MNCVTVEGTARSTEMHGVAIGFETSSKEASIEGFSTNRAHGGGLLAHETGISGGAEKIREGATSGGSVDSRPGGEGSTRCLAVGHVGDGSAFLTIVEFIAQVGDGVVELMNKGEFHISTTVDDRDTTATRTTEGESINNDDDDISSGGEGGNSHDIVISATENTGTGRTIRATKIVVDGSLDAVAI